MGQQAANATDGFAPKSNPNFQLFHGLNFIPLTNFLQGSRKCIRDICKLDINWKNKVADPAQRLYQHVPNE